MTDPNKKAVINPLLNVAVTGGTIEDFSQHALLLPAKEKPPPSQLPSAPALSQFQAQDSSILFDTTTIGLNTFQNRPDNFNPVYQFHSQQPIEYTQASQFQNQSTVEFAPQINQFQSVDPYQQFDYQSTQQVVPQGQPPPLQGTEQQSSLGSVFSSFSSILKLSGTNNQTQQVDESVPAPAGLDSFITQGQSSTNVEPVPLFSPTEANLYLNNAPTKSDHPPQGPVNTFRRAGLKRPVYAQVPGLSASFQQPQAPSFSQTVPGLQTAPLQPLVPSFSQPSIATTNPSILSEFTPSSSPALSTSSQQDSAPTSNYFKPICPQPSSFQNPTTAAQSVPIFTPNTTTTNLFAPSSASNLRSPVMAAISASEILQTSNINPESGSYPTNYNGNSIPAPSPPSSQIYRPVYQHWFHKKETEGKALWQPFSMLDSLALDQAFTSNDLDPDKVVATDGGRYDVNILRRQRIPVYWKGAPTEVRRCSWFHKNNSEGRYVPYEENVATRLEEEFKIAFESNTWHRKVELSSGETVVFHAPDVLVLLPPTQSPDAWGNTPNQSRPRVVKRGMDEFDIDEGEPANVDHLLFLVHGIGSVCDLRFRPVEEVVEEFRSTSLQLVRSHYRSSCEKGIVNRVEVLPISWHAELHSDDTGIDRKLRSITLDSIPRLRKFTNDTLLDVLFYTSPVYCQTIIAAVGNELNKIYELFRQRNPNFKGGVSLGGHSLGSLILFDLLCHQHPETETEPSANEDQEGDDVVPPLSGSKPPPHKRRLSRRISYMMGSVGTGQPEIHYPHLAFQPKSFFALGSPIGMFVTVRGLDSLGEHFALPTCPSFFNIFHPYDPVAYRVESLINPELSNLKPVLIPHHKGRKRLHLELKETMARVGADLKQRVIDSMKSTWNSFYQLAMFHRPDQPTLEEEVDKAFKEQLSETEPLESEEPEQHTDLPLGLLNQNRRIDYVLQEAPFEFFNEYLFALTAHVCYWESEDTMLLILKEIYTGMNVSADDQIPQQSMTIERPPPSPRSVRQQRVSPNAPSAGGVGIDPTAPIQPLTSLGPPPTSGFMKKT